MRRNSCSLTTLRQSLAAPEKKDLKRKAERIISDLSTNLLVMFLTQERTLTHREIGKLVGRSAGNICRMRRRDLLRSHRLMPLKSISERDRQESRLQRVEDHHVRNYCGH